MVKRSGKPQLTEMSAPRTQIVSIFNREESMHHQQNKTNGRNMGKESNDTADGICLTHSGAFKPPTHLFLSFFNFSFARFRLPIYYVCWLLAFPYNGIASIASTVAFRMWLVSVWSSFSYFYYFKKSCATMTLTCLSDLSENVSER